MANDVTLKLGIGGTAAQDAAREVGAIKKSFSGLQTAIAGLAIGAGAAAVGAQASKAVAAAMESAAADARLARILRNRLGKTLDSVRPDVEKMGKTLMLNFGFGDEDAKDALGQLVNSGYSVNGALKQMGLVADVAAAKNTSLAEAAKVVGLSFQGNLRGLREFGIVLESTGNKTRDAELALTELQKTVTGAAGEQALSKPWMMLNEAVGEVYETIGGGLAGPAGKAIQTLTDFFVGMNETGVAEKLAEGFGRIADTATTMLPKVADAISGTVGFLDKATKQAAAGFEIAKAYVSGESGQGQATLGERFAAGAEGGMAWLEDTFMPSKASEDRLKNARAVIAKQNEARSNYLNQVVGDQMAAVTAPSGTPLPGAAEMIAAGAKAREEAKTALPTASTAGKVSPADEAKRQELLKKYTKGGLATGAAGAVSGAAPAGAAAMADLPAGSIPGQLSPSPYFAEGTSGPAAPAAAAPADGGWSNWGAKLAEYEKKQQARRDAERKADEHWNSRKKVNIKVETPTGVNAIMQSS